uniref:Uncharacterized protein n=1 Tax=Romanomermis culicivorax TaxID=13658 RepID=A0A915JW36_ROMCU
MGGHLMADDSRERKFLQHPPQLHVLSRQHQLSSRNEQSRRRTRRNYKGQCFNDEKSLRPEKQPFPE